MLLRLKNLFFSSGAADTRGCIAEGRRIYAIGDIHGQAHLLDRLLRWIARDIGQRPCIEPVLVFLGDYIDRGPASAEVIERLAASDLPGTSHCFLQGNHESMFLDFLRSPVQASAWLDFGGRETLVSYGIRSDMRALSDESLQQIADDLRKLVPQRHLDFFNRLNESAEFDGYFFAHAGVRPGVPLAKQQKSDLLWIRESFLTHGRMLEKVIVHGHTPKEAPENLPWRINVDTGAYATQCLTATVLESRSRAFLSASADARLDGKLRMVLVV